MKIDMFSYAENFITEDEVLVSARARGVEVGTRDVSVGTGSYLRHLAHTIAAQSVVEVGTGAGVGSIWILRGMIESGTLTSIDDEAEHANIARLAFAEAGIAPARFRLITNPMMEVLGKLTERAYDLVVLRHDSEDLEFSIEQTHRILRSGGVLVIDAFFGEGKVPDPSQRDSRTIALREAGKNIRLDSSRWISTLIHVGDGILLATKL